MNLRLPGILLCALVLSACGSWGGSKRAPSGPYKLSKDVAPADHEIPADIANTPDPVPRVEPISRSGNPDSYEVFGKTYKPVKRREPDFRESGKASWYGKKFHGNKTASGEVYDMFKMTAAHKTLPLPSYVRVTRRDNGKSCIVRVNDRGPFHPGRIIDLSYAAAARLGMIGIGEAPVEIEVVGPDDSDLPPPAPAPEIQVARWKPGYWVVGTYSDPIDAAAVREDLASSGLGAGIQDLVDSGQALLEVIVGPFEDEAASLQVLDHLRQRGHSPQWRVN